MSISVRQRRRVARLRNHAEATGSRWVFCGVRTMLRKKVFDLLESEVRSYPRNFPCILDRARGTELVDVNGRRYLDFLGGAGSLNYGHNNPILKSALMKYIERDGI